MSYADFLHGLLSEEICAREENQIRRRMLRAVNSDSEFLIFTVNSDLEFPTSFSLPPRHEGTKDIDRLYFLPWCLGALVVDFRWGFLNRIHRDF